MQNSRRLFLHQLGREFGVIDIDALDDAITDEQLLEFRAAAWIHGWDHGRRPEASLIAAIRNQMNVTMALQTTDFRKTIDGMTFHDATSVIEEMTQVEKKKSKTALTPQQFEQHLKAQYGT